MANIVKSPCDEVVIRTTSSHEPCPRDVRPWILGATIFGSSMAMIDGNVVNLVLPVMQARLFVFLKN